MDQQSLNKILPIVILFLLATTMFNTLRATKVDHATTAFRVEARRQLALTRVALEEQKQINADLQQQILRLHAEDSDEAAD